jgi:isopropylmalate/homocitrate/citramalate synthase
MLMLILSISGRKPPSEEIKHVQELIDRKETGRLKALFPYLPEFVGHRSKVVMAEKVTRLVIEFNLNELGIKATDKQINEIHRRVKNVAMKERRIVSEGELRTISDEVVCSKIQNGCFC